MNHRWIFVWLAVFLVACSSPSTSGKNSNSTSDAGQDAVSGDTVSGDTWSDTPATDTGDTANMGDTAQCACSTQSTCCDGCQPTNMGEDCDDGLTCTLGTTCQADGTCAGATASPCDDQVDSPDCQVATCDEVAGCTVQNAHEGFDCQKEGIRDATCHDGQCQGTVCTCDADDACCDGCVPIHQGDACDDGDPDTGNDVCTDGTCTGTPCTCTDGACCDGCLPLPVDTVCGDMVDDTDVCDPNDNTVIIYRQFFQACDGVSPDCGSHTVAVDQVGDCRGSNTCQWTGEYYECI